MTDGAPAAGITRKRFLCGAAGAVGLAALGGGAFGIEQVLSAGRALPHLHAFRPPSRDKILHYRSRPDLRPPNAQVKSADAAPGALLLAPGYPSVHQQQGPMILDHAGEPLWYAPVPSGQLATNLDASHYRGEPVLFWWQGKVSAPGFGQGHAVIVDSAYRPVARVQPGNGRQMDLHEFRLTPQGTALFTCYPNTVTTDLSSVGGPSQGKVLEPVFQELDLTTGRVLLEWRSLDHIDVSESYATLGEPWDYLHLNSIDVAPDGNLLVCARHTWAVYKIDRRSGAIIWRLGGKRSDFAMEQGSQFAWQHDARAHSDTEISLFDDGSDGHHNTEHQSRGLLLTVDHARRRVRVSRSYRHPHRLLTSAMGNMQMLPNGHVLVGWGTASHVSEFDAAGRLVADVSLPYNAFSYRAYRLPWTGTPAHRPAVTVRRERRGGQRTMFVSWNGATQVAHWEIHAGPAPTDLKAVGIAPRRGFETAIPIRGDHKYVAAVALDRARRPLARSAIVS